METKWRLLEFLIGCRRDGKRVVGYGAPGKGNTLLNYCGIRTDLLDFTVDRNPYKQGQFLPGTHIPIREPEALSRRAPDYILILPWNLTDEIVAQLAYAREWGARFVVPIPEVRGAVKVVIFCGGQGLRMREASERAEADGADRQPAGALARDEVLRPFRATRTSCSASATRPRSIKQFFLTYNEAMANDFVLSNGGADVHLLKTDIHDWNITFVDTGLRAPIGERLRAVRHLLADDELFLANYGDTLTDADLPAMIARAKEANAMASFLAVRPNYSFHVVSMEEDGRVRAMRDVMGSDIWINGGYFVLRREFLDQLRPGEDLVEEPLQRLLAGGQGARAAARRVLGAHGHPQGQAVAREPSRGGHGPVAGLGPRPRHGRRVEYAAAG